MELKRLISPDELKCRDIICLGGKENQIEQFCDFFNGLCCIKEIISIDTNHPDNLTINGKDIPCYSMSELVCNNDNFSLVILDDYYHEYYNELTISGLSKFINIVWWFADRETSLELVYRDKYADSKLENIIVFRSGPHASEYIKGMDFSDNARALFEFLLRIKADINYQMVWLVNNPEDYAAKYENRNVRFISWNWAFSDNEALREEYYRPICLAKLLFFTDAYGFARNSRKDQIRIQLWHGVGFKSRMNFVKCENRYEYKIDTGKVFAKKSVELYGLREDQVKILGYPKIDWLFENNNKDILSVLGIPRMKKIIVWAPTFRNTGGKFTKLDQSDTCFQEYFPILDTEEKIKKINDVLKEKDILLIVKLHPYQDESMFKHVNYSNIITLSSRIFYENDIQTNQFVKYADALISDYSSIATEFMQLDRPIAFTIDNIDIYEKERGFAFNPIEDWLPGIVLRLYEDFEKFVVDVSEGIDVGAEIRHYLYPKMHSFKGWGSSERIAKEFGIII